MDAVLTQHVVMTPGVLGGKPRIAGTRIRVMDVVYWHRDLGWTVEKIAGQFPTLTSADIHAALAFYYDNVELIDEAFQRESQFESEFREQYPQLVWQPPA